ncbi:hypothetical protein [Stieleria mannarensis]|uniref:hypothetical protein n=1 Tax=Stieleria mannarensis TaxID=2755585 RepID=UPI0015FF04CE|nr:hypothetical protein [Rhodopirellula sp. JC639]
MKFLPIAVLFALLGSCSPQASNDYDAAYQKQLDDYDRQTEQTQQQLDQTQDMQDETERQLARSKTQADRYDALLDRWEQQADRHDKLLDLLESISSQNNSGDAAGKGEPSDEE